MPVVPVCPGHGASDVGCSGCHGRAMWWQGFDLVRFQSAAADLPHGQQHPERRPGCGRASKARPQEASFGAEKRSRPLSAPALLRGEGHLSRYHTAVNGADAMGQKRQAIEELAVDLSKLALRQEALEFRRQLRQSVAADPCHQDLHVLHNGAARARTVASRPQSASAVGSPPRRVTSPRPQSASAVGSPPRRATAPRPQSTSAVGSPPRRATAPRPQSASASGGPPRRANALRPQSASAAGSPPRTATAPPPQSAGPAAAAGEAGAAPPPQSGASAAAAALRAAALRPQSAPTAPADAAPAGPGRAAAGGPAGGAAPPAGSAAPRRRGEGRGRAAGGESGGAPRGASPARREACADGPGEASGGGRGDAAVQGGGLGQGRGTITAGGSASKGPGSDADQLKRLRTLLHHDVARHCKRIGIEVELLQGSTGLDIAKKMRSFTRFIQLQRMGQMRRDRNASSSETPGLTAGMTSALKRRLAVGRRKSQVPAEDADIPDQVSDKDALVKLAAFFAGLDMPLRDALSRIGRRGEHHFRLHDWNYGLAQLGFTGNAAQAFRLLDAREWRVLTVAEVEAQLLRLDKRLAVPAFGERACTMPGLMSVAGRGVCGLLRADPGARAEQSVARKAGTQPGRGERESHFLQCSVQDGLNGAPELRTRGHLLAQGHLRASEAAAGALGASALLLGSLALEVGAGAGVLLPVDGPVHELVAGALSAQQRQDAAWLSDSLDTGAQALALAAAAALALRGRSVPAVAAAASAPLGLQGVRVIYRALKAGVGRARPSPKAAARRLLPLGAHGALRLLRGAPRLRARPEARGRRRGAGGAAVGPGGAGRVAGDGSAARPRGRALGDDTAGGAALGVAAAALAELLLLGLAGDSAARGEDD
ncbi:unnamed protein product [Prorocentrum cordatum]|uniref:Uncharacterized protein n=1 Tax=Prorocentrum cordatum TaxID=2364126 RepID=A0ABN9UHC9_9DINO|nr:unnamed protein product [Polarella glacialis]